MDSEKFTPASAKISKNVSIEISPCSSKEETLRLIEKLKCLNYKPLLIGISCHNLEKNKAAVKEVTDHGFEVMLHLPGGMLSQSQVVEMLKFAQNIGIKYILAIRGDKVCPDADFPHASYLVEFIRKMTGDYFTIAVGGYPEKHPEAISIDQDILYLKKKVDAGADFIISQPVFSSETFINFVYKCRQAGIIVPIVPGILVIQSLKSLQKFAEICQIKIPEQLEQEMSEVETDSEIFHNWRMNFISEMVSEIFEAGMSNRAHFFTLNQVHDMQHVYNRLNFNRKLQIM